jgi:aspartate ammonia-lyase
MLKQGGVENKAQAAWIPQDGGTWLAVSHHAASSRSLGTYVGLCQRLLQVKLACANANLKARSISESDHQKIVVAISALQNEMSADDFPVDVLQGGGAIAINTNVNERIACLIDAQSYKEWVAKINTNQSTADVCATAVRLALRDELAGLGVVLDHSVEVLQKFARDNQTIFSLARTCLRDAMPVSIGEKFRGAAEALNRCRSTMLQNAERCLTVNLGGTVIGDTEATPRTYRESVIGELCRTSNLSVNARSNLFDAAQNSDDLGIVIGGVELLASQLIRIAKDQRLMNSGPLSGFGELIFTKTMPGSSYFSNKTNPILCESMMQVSWTVLGQMRSAWSGIEHAELDLNVFDWFCGVQIIDAAAILTKAIRNQCSHVWETMQVDEERCRQLIASWEKK